MKIEYSRNIIATLSKIKLHEYPSRGSELFHADRHEEAESSFPQFRESI